MLIFQQSLKNDFFSQLQLSKTFFILITLLQTSCYDHVQYDQGLDDSIHFSEPPKTTLQFGTSVPRCNWSYIKFETLFDQLPNIIISLTFLDWQHGIGSGILIETEDIQQLGFQIKTTALTEHSIYGAYIQWFAFIDPMLQVQYFESNNLIFTNDQKTDIYTSKKQKYKHQPQLSTVIFVEFKQKYWELNGKQNQKIPNVQIYLNGFKLHGQTSQVLLKIETINPSGVYIKILSRDHLRFIRICVVYGDKEIIYTSREQLNIISDQKFTNTEYNEKKVVNINNKIKNRRFNNLKDNFTYMFGLSGFYTDFEHNSRILIENAIYQSNFMSFSIGSYFDTKLFSLSYEVFIYQPDMLQKIFREQCAEIFSECNFEGKGVQICETINNMESLGFKTRIKSLYVPKGFVLSITYKTNQEAQSVKIEKENIVQKKEAYQPSDKEIKYRQTIDCIEDLASEKMERSQLKNQYMGRRLTN